MKPTVLSTLTMKLGSWERQPRSLEGLAFAAASPPASSHRRGSQGGICQTAAPLRALRCPVPASPTHPVGSPLSTHHCEVSLLHFLQQDAQGLQIEDNVIGFLQP